MVEKIKYYFKELLKIFSNQPSFFSKKRIMEFSAFYTFLISYIIYFFKKYGVMSAEDLLVWGMPLLFVAGFNLYMTQKEKKDDINL